MAQRVWPSFLQPMPWGRQMDLMDLAVAPPNTVAGGLLPLYEAGLGGNYQANSRVGKAGKLLAGVYGRWWTRPSAARAATCARMKEAGRANCRGDRKATAAIDAALVRRLVAEQFPRYRELPVSPVTPGGHDNRTFRVGRSLGARLPSASRYAPHLLAEFEWLPRLAGHLPLQIPQPVGLGAPGAGYPWHWTLNRWIPGEPAERANIGDLGEFARRLARFLAALHAVDATDGPAPGAAELPPVRRAYHLSGRDRAPAGGVSEPH